LFTHADDVDEVETVRQVHCEHRDHHVDDEYRRDNRHEHAGDESQAADDFRPCNEPSRERRSRQTKAAEHARE